MGKYSGETLNFFDRVYEVVVLIPEGRVTSYGAIAKYLGAARSSRMVGWAMNAVHSRPNIPAHRVVNRIGMLTGKHHFPGTNMMERLLREEGVNVVDDKIENFKQLFWDPSTELNQE